MKLIRCIVIIFIFTFSNVSSQSLKYLGLSNSHLTSIKLSDGIIAAGTYSSGVYWQPGFGVSDSGWNNIYVNGARVLAVYPHKSGPLGWAIGIGAEPNIYSNEFVFCSYLGGTPKKMSYGIDTNYTQSIYSIDGFTDPTICGETFAIGNRMLYRRNFDDTVWAPVYTLSIEGHFECIKAKERYRTILTGGGEGFANTLLLRSVNNGTTWNELFPACLVADVDFTGEGGEKIILTDGSKIKSSSDFGITWEDIFSSDSLMIRKLFLSSNGNTIYAAANSVWYNYPRSYYLYSKNMGESWSINQLPVYDVIAGADLDADSALYLAYISEGLYKLQNPVVNIHEPKNEIMDKEFNLSQNFPNPFNPFTVINFSVPSECHVVIKVFDLLGKEEAVLVNENKKAGSYSVNFDASGLSSGLYFYSMIVGQSTFTKKMIFLR